MSFHGGIIGVILALVIFSRRRNINILSIGDAVACAVPIGLFFGRLDRNSVLKKTQLKMVLVQKSNFQNPYVL